MFGAFSGIECTGRVSASERDEMAASGPGITDIKMLFARSGNRCAFPKCTAPMAFNETLTGEVCHIKGARPGSARYDRDQSATERHDYKNLVLMCPTHHTVIDDDADAYSVDYLLKLKTANEQRSEPVADDEASRVAQHFLLISNQGQSGGISAHTVNASQITLQSAPSTNHLTHQRQIQAIEALWQIVRDMGNAFSLVIFIDNILIASEKDAYFRRGEHAHILDCVREYADMNTAIDKLKAVGALDASKERPFVSHRLWSVFFVLQAIYARSALLIMNSYKERKFVDWRDDSGCDQLLRAILPPSIVDEAKSKTFGGLHQSIDHLESQFLAEAGMNKRA
jgi:hypothetical protein